MIVTTANSVIEPEIGDLIRFEGDWLSCKTGTRLLSFD